MKPSLVFYNDGNYTGIRHGDIEVDSKVDAYNSYMKLLVRPELLLYRFDLGIPKCEPLGFKLTR